MLMKKHVKKIAADVDNFPNYSEKRYQMICQIQGFLNEGCSYREIVQFTVLSGRHSVLERPLSAAKRPLILTDCR